uniref:Uncharacterized protein n=1 Tax=Rhizophora mucronata TaxID=61149 RepID=A0A2P2IIU1_RHIMU
MEVTRRLDADKSKWFKLPWEERMKSAHQQGTLVLLRNLDPSCTSAEVEVILREFTTVPVLFSYFFSMPILF